MKHNDTIIIEALNIRGAIIANGGMATKSVVEDILMLRHPIDRFQAHEIMNHIEYYNLNSNKTSSLDDYPEISQVNVPFFNRTK